MAKSFERQPARSHDRTRYPKQVFLTLQIPNNAQFSSKFIQICVQSPIKNPVLSLPIYSFVPQHCPREDLEVEMSME